MSRVWEMQHILSRLSQVLGLSDFDRRSGHDAQESPSRSQSNRPSDEEAIDLLAGASNRQRRSKGNGGSRYPAQKRCDARQTRQRNGKGHAQRLSIVDLGVNKLAELHKHALIGWPTLRQASEMSGVKVGTIKARCEKGQLRSYRDLTKRLRINPSELDGLHLRLRTTKPTPGEARFKAPTPPPMVQGIKQTPGTVYLEHGGIRKAPRSSASGEVQTKCREIGWPESNLLPADPFNKPQIDQGGVRTPLRGVQVNPPIKVISRRDYGLPEVENPSSLRAGQTTQPQRQGRTTGFLNYNPDKPFSIAACVVGKTVRYDDCDGMIVGIVDDPFSPQIKVRFAAHHNPLMREVLLIVGKRRVADQARDLRLERNPL